LLAQIFLKGSLDQLWSLFFTIQLIVFLNIYAVPISSFSEIYTSELTKLVQFDILNPDGLLKLIEPDMSLKKLITNQFVKDLLIYFLIAFIFVSIILLMLLLQLIPYIRTKV
jgi:hypothetical protein